MIDCTRIAKVTIEGGLGWSARQRTALVVLLGVALAVLCWWSWSFAAAVLMTSCVAVYFVGVAFRTVVFAASDGAGATVRLADDRLPDRQCPPAVILVAAYHEAEVLPDLMQSLARMDYPHFHVLLILEERDAETIARAEIARAALTSAHDTGAAFRVVVVPAAAPGPAGKPRALNYALEQNAALLDESEFVVIFDAEDHPDPHQLRMAAQAFRHGGSRLGAVQAELRPVNAGQNWFTWMWAGLYANTFRVNLAGLARIGSIVPLGGTSNYVRTEALRHVGGWDMYNVTEDLDLGVKLRRAGYRVLMLPSVTWEEATATFTDQVKQASRWMKGHAATAIAHLRHPLDLIRDLGFVGSLGFFTFVVLPVPATLFGPVFWALTLWYITQQPAFIREITPQGTLYLGLLCLVANGLFVWQVMIAMRRSGQYLLVPLMPLVLLYVQTVSVCATAKAVWEISRGRFYYWDKTKHYGVSTPAPRPLPATGAVPARAIAPAISVMPRLVARHSQARGTPVLEPRPAHLDATLILAEAHVQHPMPLMLDPPAAAHGFAQGRRRERPAEQVGARPRRRPVGQPPTPLVHRLMVVTRHSGTSTGLRLSKALLHIGSEAGLVVFERRHGVAALLQHLVRDAMLTAHRIDRHQAARRRPVVEQIRPHRDLVRLIVHGTLGKLQSPARDVRGRVTTAAAARPAVRNVLPGSDAYGAAAGD